MALQRFLKNFISNNVQIRDCVVQNFVGYRMFSIRTQNFLPLCLTFTEIQDYDLLTRSSAVSVEVS